MKPKFTNSFFGLAGPRDYSQDLAAMKRTAAKADKDPAYSMKLILMTGMYTKTGKLKKQFR
jgi:hypothetical protein